MVSKIASFRLLLVTLIIGCSSNKLEKRPDTPVGQLLRMRHFMKYLVSDITLWQVRLVSRKKGLASWYGPKFHSNKTSIGETFDMYKMTIAHKTLPLPSKVLVTNLENGKQIVVRVNDRGPLAKDRIIILTYLLLFMSFRV